MLISQRKWGSVLRRFGIGVGFVVTLVVVFLDLLPARKDAKARDISTVQRELLLLLQGDPVVVTGRPVLCKPGSTEAVPGTPQWYFGRQGSGKQGCMLTYPPSLTAIVTPASDFRAEKMFASPRLQTQLGSILDELNAIVMSGKMTLQQQLMVHSTAWEITFGLHKFSDSGPDMKRQLAPLTCKSLRLLEGTRFSSAQIDLLPATLERLPEWVDSPDVRSTIELLQKKDSGVLEVVPPTDVHADVLYGRFTPRIFLWAARPADRERLRQYLQESGITYKQMRDLPLTFPGIRATLVLFFNVFTEDFRITPTQQVAFFQQYTFSDRTSYDLPFQEVEARITFLTVRYERMLSAMGGAQRGAEYSYRIVDQDEPVPDDILEAKPTNAGDFVTSVRGQCLRCHRYRIVTFATHGVRPVRFERPLQRKGRELLTEYYLWGIEKKIREWKQSEGALCKTVP